MPARIDQVDIFTRQRIFRALRRKARRRLPRPPRWMYPVTPERQYVAALLRVVAQMREVVEREMVPIIDSVLRQATINIPTSDAWDDDVEQASNRVGQGFSVALSAVAPAAALAAQAVDAYNAGQFAKVTKRVFGDPVRGPEAFTDDTLRAFVKQNVALVQKLADDTRADIERLVFDAHRRQITSVELKKQLLSTTLPEGVFRKVKTRAALIARDQVGKLNGQITQYRQNSIGVTRYIWRTAMDERVRGRPGGMYPNAIPSHWAREGKTYSWNKPPEGGHPGEAINCRCYAEAILEDVLEGFEF